ncbi:MAG: hypothetical protein FJX71_01745 [Alphaproteobacteria bacterium]|nr:hypothetical protein [Alphaproteobacteria bacterium]
MQNKRKAPRAPSKDQSYADVKRFWNLGQVGLILACMFFIIPLCTLPPLRLGFYSQVETSLIALWVSSAISCLWIGLVWQKNPKLVENIVKLPLVWGPILLGTFSLALCTFHILPLRDLVGSGQIGEGVLTLFSVGIMAAHFSLLSRLSRARKALFLSAVLVGIIISTLTIIGSQESPFYSWRYWKWAPFFFPDFLAFIDIALMAIYLHMRKEIKGNGYIKDGIALCAFGIIAYYASNKSLGYGLIIAALSMVPLLIFPHSWRRGLIQICFFSITLLITFLVIFYDDISRALPPQVSFLGNISTLTSRTWLSKISLVDLWYNPLDLQEIKRILIGSGWGTFGNISAANMFLIDEISLFAGSEYQPSWELVDRDLMHTHNVLTNIFHSLGLMGVGIYLFTQYKLINSFARHSLLLGSGFLIAYQIQILFWFQFTMTIPFTLLAFSLFARVPSKGYKFNWLRSKILTSIAITLLFFSVLNGFVACGFNKKLIEPEPHASTEQIETLITSPNVYVEGLFGAQRQVRLLRRYALDIQKEFEKSPAQLLEFSLKIVKHLESLPKGGNYLANNIAINILSELASKTEVLNLFDSQTYELWENLVKDHIALMPYRTDILIPFFTHYQMLGKESKVLDFAHQIRHQNPSDPIALWFIGSCLLRDPSRFDEGMCTLRSALHSKVERFIPIPSQLKIKITRHLKACP